MIAALRVLEQLSALPSVVKRALFAVGGALLVVSVAYCIGSSHGAKRVAARAIADSVVHQREVVKEAQAVTDRGVTAARAAERAVTTSRQHTRAVLAAAAAEIPPATMAVIAAQLVQDSTLIAIQSHTIDAALAERGSSAVLDTLQQHQAGTSPPISRGISTGEAVKWTVAVVAVVAVVQTARMILHARTPVANP